jgi:hypothetical protein
MRCARAEKLIPLFVGGDLLARETDALRRHLECCAVCRRLATEFEESRDWLRGFDAPQFDDATLDCARDSALRDIDRIENRARSRQWIVPGWNLRFIGSMAVLLLIVAVAAYVYRGGQPRTVPDEKDSALKNPSHDQKESIGGARRNNGGIKINPAPVPARPSIRKIRHGVIESHSAKPAQSPDQALARAAAPPPTSGEPAFGQPGGDTVNGAAIFDREMTRIEFQTADPNIRIVWLAPKESNSSSTRSNANVR